MKKIIILILPAFFLISCTTDATSFTAFTTENIMRVHQGMSSDEILNMFGQPKNVRIAVCGSPPNQWTCTTWEYGESLYSNRASFTFTGEHNALLLNNFNVDRD